MSGALSIALVTEALRRRVQSAFLNVPSLSSSPQVTTGKPASGESGLVPDVGANIYLYQVTPNAALRNRDLATRDGQGNLVRRPEVALDLSYLLTFYGREDLLEPQRLLGFALAALNAAPDFGHGDLDALISGSDAVPFLAGASLDTFRESVRLTPVALSLEELSKIWTVFFQAAHRLSVAYVASPVILAADVFPVPALPARRLQVDVQPRMPPTISGLEPVVLSYAADTTLRIKGSGFGQSNLAVQIADLPTSILATGPDFLEVGLPSGVLAGDVPVSVGLVAVDSGGFVPSDSAALTLQPKLGPGVSYQARKSPPSWPDVKAVVLAMVQPELDANQDAQLLLTPLGGDVAAAGVALDVCLSFVLEADLAKGLHNGAPSAQLAKALKAAGYPLSHHARLVQSASGGPWSIVDGQEVIALRMVRGQFIATPWLGATDSLLVWAFSAPSLAKGQYLVRLRIGDRGRAISPLLYGEKLFQTSLAETKALDAGQVSARLRTAFSSHGVALGKSLTVTSEGGLNWQIAQIGRTSRYLMRAEEQHLAAYALDTPRSAYIGPVLTVP